MPNIASVFGQNPSVSFMAYSISSLGGGITTNRVAINNDNDASTSRLAGASVTDLAKTISRVGADIAIRRASLNKVV